ncbi:hypothetical protein [Caldalkalibacillus mannanilyticus]|uniref:hypothetical protein n=1 Tax=Caldalkalibacillus mannanilyticus TaxID=1418 RepID=UPI0004696573|nr:hypothetical protein [Caldalkalibacillus mannanilyticus]
MSRVKKVFIGSYAALKMYLFIITGLVGVVFLTNFILGITGISAHPEISSSNIATIFLLFMAGVLPLYFFKRIMNLGASRKDYYYGTMIAYVFWVAIFSVFNIIWFLLEKHIFEFKRYINIIEAFGWDRYGILEMFFYQFFAYLFVVALFNLLFSGVRDKLAIPLYIILVAFVSMSMSISTLRDSVFQVLGFLFFNPSLIFSTLLTCIVIGFLFLFGWFFTARREII